MRYMVRSLIGFGLLALTAAWMGGAGELLAQTSKPGEPEVLQRDQVRARSGFRLFGDRDQADSGFRLVGGWRGCTNNTGNITTDDQCFDNLVPGALDNTPNWFDIYFYMAAPPSERDKHAATVPSLANAAGKGYTVNSGLSTVTGDVLPADGTLGPMHAGVQSREDGSCLDLTGSQIDPGNPLLSINDCAETWGSLGWQGTRFVDQDGYLGFAAQVGDMNFTFDNWRVPEDLKRTDKFMGSVQSYGFFSDYSADVLFGSAVFQSYGNVIPESMGGDPAEAPGRTGWPLGIQVKQDAFSFAAPGLGNTAWYMFTAVNNSADVYGVGLDYDSLYMGIQAGWLTWEQGTSSYRDPGNGVTRGATFCTTPTCGPGGDPMHPGDQWGSIPPNGVGTGFNYGAAAIIVMKSPIGDLRNKQFTDPASPFFGKGDPGIWDDTIPFNHSVMCGFHGCSAVIWSSIVTLPPLPNTDFEQRQFGMVANIVSDVMGDRAVGDPTDHTMWDTFRWEEFPDRGQLDFNRWTPGNWDWDGDGVDDELVYPDCSDNSGPQFDPITGNSKNCSVSWSDTLPAGFGNVYSNAGQVSGVGPIPLQAGDTASWVIALVHANDFTGIENDIAKAIDHYQAFFLGPEPAPGPTITSVEIEPGGQNATPEGTSKASVTLYLDATTEEWIDPFLAKFLADMLAAPAGSDLGNIRDLNPFLVDTLVALIPNNVEFIHVFKSCDGGDRFTNDADCFGDPATGGILGDLGWLPFQTLEADAAGNFDNIVTDNALFGGRSYLYSLVTETRGLTVGVRTGVPGDAALLPDVEDVGTGDGSEANFTGSLGFTPVFPLSVAITAGIQTVTDDGNGNLVGDVDLGGVNTIDYLSGVYDVTFALAPLSGEAIEANYQYAFFTCVAQCASTILEIAPKLTPSIGTSTGSPSVVNPYIPVSDQSGSLLADVTLLTESPDFVPFSRMSVVSTASEVLDGEYDLLYGDEVIVEEVATIAATGVTVDQTTVEVIDGTVSTTFTSPGAVGVEGDFEETIVGDQRTRTWTFDSLTAVLTAANGVPLTVTDDLTGGQTVPGAYFGLVNFPRFTFSVDNGLGGGFNTQNYLDANGELIGPLVEPSVTYLQGEASGVTAASEGRYDIAWADQAYGSGSPFVLNFGDPNGTRDMVVQSIVSRAVGQVTSTDAAIALAIGVAPEDLLAVNLPFEFQNITDIDNPSTVTVAIERSGKVTQILLGNGLDTLFVDVPENEWVPGDELILLENDVVLIRTTNVGCLPALWQRITCNPVALSSRGATGYIPNGADQDLLFGYFQTITSETQYSFEVSSAVTGDELASRDPQRIVAGLDSVHVVPNPFVMFSQYSTSGGEDRILFTHMPPNGVLRIFTVSGQFVQQISFDASELSAQGDLWFNLRTREGLEMAAGLYLYVLEALDESGNSIGTTKGKFVLIR